MEQPISFSLSFGLFSHGLCSLLQNLGIPSSNGPIIHVVSVYRGHLRISLPCLHFYPVPSPLLVEAKLNFPFHELCTLQFYEVCWIRLFPIRPGFWIYWPDSQFCYCFSFDLYFLNLCSIIEIMPFSLCFPRNDLKSEIFSFFWCFPASLYL